MSTYLKFILIAALFLTTGAASVLADSDMSSSSSTTEQSTVKKATSKEDKKAEASSERTSDTSTKPSETTNQSTSSSEANAQSNHEGASETKASSTAAEETTASPEATDQPEPVVNEAEPASQTAESTDNQNVAEPEQPTSIQADQLMINGQFISYSNAGQGSGQAIIDANPNQVATWGGAAVQSGNDGANTHFIGHNPGIFNVLFSVGAGAKVEVSDSSNNVTSYTVSQVVTVDDSGMAEDGTDYWDQITGTGGGERITLQTCINDDYNLIVFANK
ncbi:hypothetical protein IGI39_003877 [Enterococcus sp. AZ135]|uniref:class F sortase n=1 Tax=unclassified Enterococcus TaxID=2608891 RepID=UPI003F23E788